MARNLSNWSTKRERQQKCSVFGCLSPKPWSFVFSGQQGCNLNRDRLKKGNRRCVLRELGTVVHWPVSILVIDILSLCHTHTLHLASEHNGWKSPQSQGETNTFALFSLAAGAGRWNWWLCSLITWLQCHLLVIDSGAETTTLWKHE